MRIEIRPSARRHGITDDEIRTVVEYPGLRMSVASRKSPDAHPELFIGQAAANEPYLEVAAEVIDRTTEVFHATMLRQSTVTSTGIAEYLDPAHITRTQRR
ncbi:hypothetical protein HUN08_00515 [Gordonia sp. X0973]|uniref:hypothetical protein n=1 Tax=Gordonia sp. X0973 TaxID=2742602 RepID=UPI000F54956A|nr:hypothetical protein [Gordonia sp. X0973]QKT05847.1 hypothetical protein HUN08_00515 [Gordonia sp. X0973]